jgi:hypothetical protein
MEDCKDPITGLLRIIGLSRVGTVDDLRKSRYTSYRITHVIKRSWCDLIYASILSLVGRGEVAYEGLFNVFNALLQLVTFLNTNLDCVIDMGRLGFHFLQ